MERHNSPERESNPRDYLGTLFKRAFLVVPGPDYNRVSFDLREGNAGEARRIYEMVVEEEGTWEDFRDRFFSSLVRYLKSKSLDPCLAEGLVVSLFCGDRFYLIRYQELVDVFCEMEGIRRQDFRSRVRCWLSGESQPRLLSS